MAEQTSPQSDMVLEQSRQAWRNFGRITKYVVALAAVTVIIIAFATL